MPQYAVIMRHPPDNCPLTNKAVRDFTTKMGASLPALAQQLDVRILANIHLDPGHKAFMLFEAPNAEVVRDFLARGGFMHYTDMDFHLVTPIEELTKHMDDMPTIY